MFPFFPFGPVPPLPLLFPFTAMAWLGAARPRAGDQDDPGPATATPFAPVSMMSMAMMPAMAPFALGSRLAQVADDARKVAAHVTESLDRDDGPVHVVVGDPDGPMGLAIGLTFIKRGQRPMVRAGSGSPRVEGMVDVTPPPAPSPA